MEYATSLLNKKQIQLEQSVMSTYRLKCSTDVRLNTKKGAIVES